MKIDKSSLDLITYDNNFGYTDLSEILAQPVTEQTQKALIETFAKETQSALWERAVKARKDGRGKPKGKNSEKFIAMTFRVNIDQLEKIREIGFRESKFTKEVLFEALDDYIRRYETANGEVKPRELAKQATQEPSK